jgi:hypothetical protein
MPIPEFPHGTEAEPPFETEQWPRAHVPGPQHLGMLHNVARYCNAFPELRVSVTVGQEPEIELALV